MEADNWEALDLDDSDLHSFLRPCKRKRTPQNSPPPPTPKPNSQPSQTPKPNPPTVIPGPAGVVQTAMLYFGEEPLPTQEYIRRAVEDPGADNDFSVDPWHFALEFIRREGLAGDGGTIGTPLSWIKTEPKMGSRKVSQVVAIIKSCTPNGLGDLMVTLKDPTGTIDASIHRKVLAEGGLRKDISVGTVLILQKVSIFSALRSCYLNITLSNVVKAVSKDSGASLQQNCPASMVTPIVHGVENVTQPSIQKKVCTLSQERTKGIMNSLRQAGYMGGTVHNDKGLEGDEALGSSCSTNGRSRSQNALVEKDYSIRQGTVCGIKKVAVLVGTNEYEETVVLDKQPSPRNLAERGDHLESNRSNGGANMVGVANNQESATINGDRKQRRLPLSRGSLPQWTDEQLDELLDFD